MSIVEHADLGVGPDMVALNDSIIKLLNGDFGFEFELKLLRVILFQHFLGRFAHHNLPILSIRLHFIRDDHIHAVHVIPHNLRADDAAVELSLGRSVRKGRLLSLCQSYSVNADSHLKIAIRDDLSDILNDSEHIKCEAKHVASFLRWVSILDVRQAKTNVAVADCV